MLPASLLRTALDCAPCGLVVLEKTPETATSFTVSLMNTAAEKLSGLTEAAVLGQLAEAVLGEVLPGALWGRAAGVAESGDGHQAVYWFTQPDGTRCCHDLHICPHPGGVIVAWNDVTNRQAEKELLAGIVTHSPNGIAAYQAQRNEAGKIEDYRPLFHNPRAMELLGLRPETARLPLFEYLPEGRKGAEHLRAVVEEKAEIDTEYFYAPSQRWLEVRNRPLETDGFFGIFRDVTELREARQRIEAQNLSLQESWAKAQQQTLLLNGILQSSLSGISVYEAVRDETGTIQDFRFLLFNDQATTISPFSRAHVEAAGTMLTLYPESREKGLFYRYTEVCNTGIPSRYEHYYADYDGWFEIQVTKLGDGIVVTFNDITAQRKAAQAVEAQAHLFEGILDSLQNGLTVLEALRDEAGQFQDWRYRAVAQSNLDHTGLSRQDFLGNTMRTLFPGAVDSRYWSAYQEVLTTGQPQRFEVHYNVDGYDNYLDNTVSRLDENTLISAYTLINDQKRAAFEIEQQTQQLEGILNGSLNGILALESLHDATGAITDLRIVQANQAAATITGVALEHMVGSTLKIQYPIAQDSELFARYLHTIETGENQRFESPYFTDAQQGWFDIAISRLNDGLVMTFLDLTERKTLQLRLETLIEDLRRSNRDLEQFAYVASHDLQEPLRKIQQFGERLTRKYGAALGPDGQLFLERMLNAASRLSELIENLLRFSRLTRQSDPLAPTDLNAVLRTVLEDLSVKISETGAQISVGKLPQIEAVEGQMRQLFQNLISNALKFTRPGVPPQVHIESQHVSTADKNALRLDLTRQYVRLSVADNGIGFEAEYAEQIFVIFQRLHGRSDYEGTGIGLAIVKKIVENHGGQIRAESTPGQGATFTVVLPVKN